jgi:plastocyanin
MSARNLPSSGREAAQNELLARLGLPPSASPEDVDQLHRAASDYLASAPSSIRGWAHAQAAALDEAYLSLTDPVGLEGSALRSPTRPPAVVPGGPATPPARRDSVPAAPPTPEVAAIEAELDLDDPDALYAMVTPSAHADMAPDRKSKKARQPLPGAVVVTPAAAPPNPWKKVVIGAVGIAAAAGILFVGYNLGSSGTSAANGNSGDGAGSGTAAAQPTPPAVDMNKIGGLMEKLQANPKDIETLMALADEYYFGAQYETSISFLDKLLAIDPEHVKGLLARGAARYSIQDYTGAEADFLLVVKLAPDNQEAHYDLGFLYLNRPEPDWAGVQREWQKTVELDSTTNLGQIAQQHLDALASSSMLPAASPAGSGAPASTAPGGSPAASPAASPASSAASPAASPGASAAPAAAPAGGVINVGAADLAYDKTSLAASAGKPFTIRFDNRDSVPHDVVIKDGAGTVVFQGELVAGPSTVDYAVTALAAGSYTYLCSIHPIMTGTLTVTP